MESSWSERYRFWILSVFTVLFVAVIFFIREALNPLIVAGLIAYVLDPFVNFIKKITKMSHVLAVNVVYWLGIGLIFVLPSFYLPRLFGELERFNQNIIDIYEVVLKFISEPLVIGELVIDLSTFLPNVEDIPAITEITSDVLELLETISVNFLWFLVILVTTYYLLKDWGELRDWLIDHFPKNSQADALIIYEKIKLIWTGYLRGNLTLMLIVGVVYTIVWAALGVPAALTLGIIIGLLTIIPDIGPAIGAGIATIVAWVEGSTYLDISNGWFALLILGIYVVLINAKNIVIRPKLFGRGVKMHEGVVFVLIIMAVVMQGVLAAIIVIPLAASLSIIGKYFLAKLYGQPPFPDEVVEINVSEEINES